MIFTDDMRDIISLFEKYKVEYALVGGFAVNYYGYVRTTQDIDFLIFPSKENTEQIKKHFKSIEIYLFTNILDSLNNKQNKIIITPDTVPAIAPVIPVKIVPETPVTTTKSTDKKSTLCFKKSSVLKVIILIKIPLFKTAISIPIIIITPPNQMKNTRGFIKTLMIARLLSTSLSPSIKNRSLNNPPLIETSLVG